jgi:hypothetical protein
MKSAYDPRGQEDLEVIKRTYDNAVLKDHSEWSDILM